jgi:hypothetical protein
MKGETTTDSALLRSMNSLVVTVLHICIPRTSTHTTQNVKIIIMHYLLYSLVHIL